MHYQALKFIKVALQSLPLDKTLPLSIIEIGSLDINGTIRDTFNKYMPIKQYIGVDVGEGRGVDLVCSGEKVDFPDGTFDIAASCNCFEHNPKWLETFVNMHRMVKEGGLIIMTCASTGHREHGTINALSEDSPLTQELWGDYYKNLNEDDFKRNLQMEEMFSCYRFYYNAHPKDIYFIGYKKTRDKNINAINLDCYMRYLTYRWTRPQAVFWRLKQILCRKFGF